MFGSMTETEPRTGQKVREKTAVRHSRERSASVPHNRTRRPRGWRRAASGRGQDPGGGGGNPGGEEEEEVICQTPQNNS